MTELLSEDKIKNKGGRPTAFKPEYSILAYNYCLLGATNEDLAKYFDVSITCIHNWMTIQEEFFNAIKDGRENADAKVAKRLYKRATGYEKDGKHYPPDTTAAIFWLKNRRKDKWRDVQKKELSGPDGQPITLEAHLSPELEEKLNQLLGPPPTPKLIGNNKENG